MTFITIDNLTTHYDTSKGKVHALDNVSFSLEKGQSIGIACLLYTSDAADE